MVDNFLYDNFPDGFKLGVSSSAYQIEGGWNEDGKGASIWDVFCHQAGNISDGSSGDVACDSYHKYNEDVQLIRNMGGNIYRFSISWSRILPNGTLSEINQPGIDYYNNIINELIANGIEPMITLFHLDTPAYLEGDWLNEDIVQNFGDYARICFHNFGDRIGWIAHPIFKGDYPSVMREYLDRKSKDEGRAESRLPSFGDAWVTKIKGTCDFVGVNHFMTKLVTHSPETCKGKDGLVFDQDTTHSCDPSWPLTGVDWLQSVPWGIRKVLNWIKEEYGNPVVIVTENGTATEGTAVDIDDSIRVEYIKYYLNEVLKAIKLDGCNVTGYLAWSLLDVFEWANGYTVKLGIHAVDFNSPERTRTPKASANYLSTIFKQNGFLKK